MGLVEDWAIVLVSTRWLRVVRVACLHDVWMPGYVRQKVEASGVI